MFTAFKSYPATDMDWYKLHRPKLIHCVKAFTLLLFLIIIQISQPGGNQCTFIILLMSIWPYVTFAFKLNIRRRRSADRRRSTTVYCFTDRQIQETNSESPPDKTCKRVRVREEDEVSYLQMTSEKHKTIIDFSSVHDQKIIQVFISQLHLGSSVNDVWNYFVNVVATK